MRHLYLTGLALLFPALIALTALPGCGKKEDAKKEEGKKEVTVKKDGDSKPPVTKGKEALMAPLDGIVKGRVVYDGTPPKMAVLAQAAAHKDCKDFSAEANSGQEWIVGKEGGVANAVIFFKAPPGKYFDPAPEDKERKDIVTIDQPQCAFVPHVQVLYPEYFDGKGHKPSGQKFHVLNSASFSHNTQWEGDPEKNPRGGETIPAKSKLVAPLNAQSVDKGPITLKCDIHQWMRAKVWAFDHPYAARSDENGNFEIKNVPTGVEIAVFGWHEEVTGFFYGGKAGEKKTFKKGENNLGELKIKAK